MPKASQGRFESTSERLPRHRQTTEATRSASAQRRFASELTAGRWPEARILRKVNRGTYTSEQWRDFLDDLGDRNYGKGTAKALGSMALVYIDAQSMGRMLNKKFPKAFEDRKRTQQVMRRFQRDYGQFVRKEEQQRIDAAHEAICKTAKPVLMDEELEDGAFWVGTDELEELLVPDDVHEMRWNMGTFAVKGSLEVFGHDDVGLDLTSNDQLYKEWEETVGYCRHAGLDTNLISRNPDTGLPDFRPHMTAFASNGGIPNLQYSVEMPRVIDLDAPIAFVSH